MCSLPYAAKLLVRQRSQWLLRPRVTSNGGVAGVAVIKSLIAEVIAVWINLTAGSTASPSTAVGATNRTCCILGSGLSHRTTLQRKTVRVRNQHVEPDLDVHHVTGSRTRESR